MKDMHEDLFTIGIVLALNALFIFLTALVLWPLGYIGLAWSLAKGFGLLWVATFGSIVLSNFIEQRFRVNLYDRPNTHLALNVLLSSALVCAWSAIAMNTLQNAISASGNVPLWLAVALHIVGLLACYAGFVVVTAFYRGTFYGLVGLGLALLCFVVFTLAPAIAKTLGGWLPL
ncbi:MAG: hypothetical protein HC853_18205 [Anaerolineae bacterium]|nr:hypothetical protein [Anaerolineae bacterium]